MEDVHTSFSSYENRKNPDSEHYALLKDVNAKFSCIFFIFRQSYFDFGTECIRKKCIG